MAILLTPNKVKGSHYLLIPKGLAQLLEIRDRSVLKLTVEQSEGTQRLVYAIIEQTEPANSDKYDQESG